MIKVNGGMLYYKSMMIKLTDIEAVKLVEDPCDGLTNGFRQIGAPEFLIYVYMKSGNKILIDIFKTDAKGWMFCYVPDWDSYEVVKKKATELYEQIRSAVEDCQRESELNFLGIPN